MSEVIVEERATAVVTPPKFKIDPPAQEQKDAPGETEWMRNMVGKTTMVCLKMSGGEMGAKEIRKLTKLLEAQKAVLADDDEDEDVG